jgi:hypothetical protein
MKLYSNEKPLSLSTKITLGVSLSNNLAYYGTKLITVINTFSDTGMKLCP